MKAEPVYPRPDGATRGDKAEATALVAGGAVLLVLPFLALLDRVADAWFWLCLVAAAGGAIILGLGLRWFATEGPALGAEAASGHPACSGGPVGLPVNVRLVEARNRLWAHGLRLLALGSALLLLVVDLGPARWAVVVLFLASFVADHVLLRPRRYVLDGEGLRGTAFLSRKIAWQDVESAWWRHYPKGRRPPFPTSERLIVELRSGADLEFVFHRRYGGTDASFVVRAVQPLLGERLRVLSPRTLVREELDPRLSEQLAAPGTAGDGGEPGGTSGGPDGSLPGPVEASGDRR